MESSSMPGGVPEKIEREGSAAPNVAAFHAAQRQAAEASRAYVRARRRRRTNP